MAQCQLGNHETEIHVAALYSYRDEKHGVADNTSACPQCLYNHVRKHYVNSPIERSLKQLYPELADTNTMLDKIGRTGL